MGLHEAFERAAEEGKRIRGGCEQCNAFQTMHVVDDGIYKLTVHHDDWCPAYRAMKAGEN